MRRSPTILVAAVAACVGWLAGCEEEEKKPDPPNPVRIVSADVVCRPVEGQMTLERIQFEVEDLDGVAELNVVMVAEATRLDPRVQVQPPPEPEVEPVRVIYTWQRDPDSEQIYCGDDGKLLRVSLRVTDPDGFVALSRQPSRPQ